MDIDPTKLTVEDWVAIERYQSETLTAQVKNNDDRRHDGNALNVPPVKHRGNGVFETAVLDGNGGYFYPSECTTDDEDIEDCEANYGPWVGPDTGASGLHR